MVIGSRYIEKQANYTSTLRAFGIVAFRSVLRPILGKWVYDPTSGFVGVNREALAVFSRSFPLEYPEIEALVVLQRKAFRFEEVPARYVPRQAGSSSITAVKSIYYIIHVLLGVFVNILKFERRKRKIDVWTGLSLFWADSVSRCCSGAGFGSAGAYSRRVFGQLACRCRCADAGFVQPPTCCMARADDGDRVSAAGRYRVHVRGISACAFSPFAPDLRIEGQRYRPGAAACHTGISIQIDVMKSSTKTAKPSGNRDIPAESSRKLVWWHWAVRRCAVLFVAFRSVLARR